MLKRNGRTTEETGQLNLFDFLSTSDAANGGPSPFKRNLMLPFRIFLQWAGKRLDQDLLWITPSVMRCTYATHLLKDKATRSDVARWMGVSESIVAKYYTPRKRNSRDSSSPLRSIRR